MLTTLATLILAVVPCGDVLVDRCDVVEVNHLYDDEGKHVFDQVIWYDWHHDAGRFEVVDWRLVKCDSILPLADYQCEEYSQTWMDGETLRRVWSKSMRESWTQYDPELVERESLPKDSRRGLRSWQTR